MIQILRTDNPMLASGMKITQRLCYFNAMLHFMYAVPRLIFLLAPLIYMLGGRTIIPGYWVAILAYAMPHLVISSLTNSRVQGKHRHSFWNEIYETVLAPYILLPTLLALINPKLGKFNVTDKGSTLAETTFDRHIAAPTTWLLFFNFLGICAVPYRLIVTDPTHPGNGHQQPGLDPVQHGDPGVWPRRWRTSSSSAATRFVFRRRFPSCCIRMERSRWLP